jgi:hypothetical protein
LLPAFFFPKTRARRFLPHKILSFCDLDFRIQNAGFRVQGSGFNVDHAGIQIEKKVLGLRV